MPLEALEALAVDIRPTLPSCLSPVGGEGPQGSLPSPSLFWATEHFLGSAVLSPFCLKSVVKLWRRGLLFFFSDFLCASETNERRTKRRKG